MGGVSSPRLAGRAEQLQRLHEALDRTREGRPAGVVIGGESGIGKTRLVREFTTAATDTGVRVLWGAAHTSADGGVAFAAVEEALRPLTREFSGPMLDWLVGDGRSDLAMLLPSLAAEQPSDDAPGTPRTQRRLFTRVLELLERLAEEQPVVLVIEDVHWADRSTRQLLSFLSHNLRLTSVLFVGTYRTEHLSTGDPLREFLVDLDHSGIVERIELPPLTGDELRSLLGGVIGVPPSTAVCDEIARRSDGNPFFAEELLDAMRRNGRTALPPTLRDLLLHRVEMLDPSAREVLAVAAVVGRTVEHRLLADVAGVQEDELLRGLRQALEHQLLVPQADGQTYAFRHALTHEAVYATIPAGDRLRLHAGIARTMTQRPELMGVGGAAALAHHWDAGGQERRALPARVEAGLAAERVYGFAEARQHFTRAAQLWRRIPDQGPVEGLDGIDLLDRAARAARFLGDHAGAVALLTEALADADPVRAAVLHQRRGWVTMLNGDEQAGMDEVRQALESLPGDAPPRVRAELLAMTSAICQSGDTMAEGRLRCEQAISLARELGAADVEAHARVSLGPIYVFLGEEERGIEELLTGRRIGERIDDPDILVRSYMNLGYALYSAGRYGDALADTEEGLAIAPRAQFSKGNWAGLVANCAEMLWRVGRWEDADEASARGVAMDPDGAAGKAAYLELALVAATRGSRADVERALAAARRLGSPEDLGAIATAELAMWRGDPEAAAMAVKPWLYEWDAARAFPPPDLLAWLYWIAVRAEADRVETAAALQRDADAAQAHAAARDLLNRARRIQSPLRPVLGYQALMDAELSRAQRLPAPQLWLSAVTQWSDLGDRYLLGYGSWRHAEALANSDADAADIAAPLRTAHATASALGATALRDAIELLAVRTRIPPIEEPAHLEQPLDGPAAALGLTSRERDVLRLLAEGMTNQEVGAALFISPKTASVHVTNILRKLDVPNRGQAAAVAHRLGLAESSASRDHS